VDPVFDITIPYEEIELFNFPNYFDDEGDFVVMYVVIKNGFPLPDFMNFEQGLLALFPLE